MSPYFKENSHFPLGKDTYRYICNIYTLISSESFKEIEASEMKASYIGSIDSFSVSVIVTKFRASLTIQIKRTFENSEWNPVTWQRQ
jgi:hypothetical protein